MSDTITRRSVAHDARTFAVEAGLTEGHGSRGRVSQNVVFQYLSAQPSKSVREIAGELGVEITAKGKVSEAELLAVSEYVTKSLTYVRKEKEAEAGE